MSKLKRKPKRQSFVAALRNFQRYGLALSPLEQSLPHALLFLPLFFVMVVLLLPLATQGLVIFGVQFEQAAAQFMPAWVAFWLNVAVYLSVFLPMLALFIWAVYWVACLPNRVRINAPDTFTERVLRVHVSERGLFYLAVPARRLLLEVSEAVWRSLDDNGLYRLDVIDNQRLVQLEQVGAAKALADVQRLQRLAVLPQDAETKQRLQSELQRLNGAIHHLSVGRTSDDSTSHASIQQRQERRR